MLQQYWNTIIPKDWPIKPRNYVRPSEIGLPFADRWASMKGVKPSNPFSESTLRIFQAGNIVESNVMHALGRAGLLVKTQDWLRQPAGPHNMEIRGRLDAIIKVTDWATAEKAGASYACDSENKEMDEKARTMQAGLRELFPAGIPATVLEVKSISTQNMFSKKARDGEGHFRGFMYNKMQLYAYLLMTGIPQGYLLYVNKDNYWMSEVLVTVEDTDVKEAFWQDMEMMADIMHGDLLPEKEDMVVYNPYSGKFEVNVNIKRSQYLTYFYGFKTPKEVDDINHQEVLDVNRALKHLVAGKVKPADTERILKYNLAQYLDTVPLDEELEEDEE